MAHERHLMSPNVILTDLEDLAGRLTDAGRLGVYEIPDTAQLNPVCLEPLVSKHVATLNVQRRVIDDLAEARYLRLDAGFDPMQRYRQTVSLLGKAADQGTWLSARLMHWKGSTRNSIITTLHTPGQEDTEVSWSPLPLASSRALMEDRAVEAGSFLYTPLHAVVALNGLAFAVAERYPTGRPIL